MTADIHAEQSVLGAMILDRRAIADVRPVLTADAFFRGSHRSLYEVICHLAGQGQPADPVTIADELERRGWLGDVGGVVAIHDLVSAVPSASSALHYAKMVAGHAERRAAAAEAERAAKDAVDPTVPLAETVARLRDNLSSSRDGRIRCLSDAQLDSLAAPTWVIDGHVPEGFTVVWGPSESGKSFLVLDWAYSIASGTPWFGKPVNQCPVVYVAGEGAHGLKRRREAWRRNRGHRTDGVFTIPDPVNLLDPRDAATVAGIVGDKGAGVLVLDTLARTMHGNENDTETMGAYIATVDRIRAEHGCSALVVHHSGLDTSRMRGNQRLFSDADCVIRVRMENGSVEVSQPPAPAGKAKDSAHFEPWHLGLSVVDAGVDEDGQVVTSCVLTTAGGRARDIADEVTALLADSAPMTLMEIAGATGGDLGALNKLVGSGVIARARDGGPSARFTLPDQAEVYQGGPL